MKILWLKTGPLHPLDTGGKIRTYNMLRMLKREHHVTYVALLPAGSPPVATQHADEYCHQAQWIPWREQAKRSIGFYWELAANLLASRLPYVIHKYRSRAMSRAILRADIDRKYDLIVCDFLTPAVNLFVSSHRFQTPLLLLQHNVESLVWKRLADQAAGPARKYYFGSQYRRLERFERLTCAHFDAVVGVSPQDCAIMRGQFKLSNVLGDVPTGVDCQTYSLAESSRKPKSLVFLGSMDWMPNIDAIDYFMSEIWQTVKREFPDAAFTIVGRNPPPKIRELEKRLPGVRVTGTVADVKPFIHEAAVMIVPLRVGGGTRIKIFEGMATGIPVVSTRIGAEGLPVNHGHDILLADSPTDFAAGIRSLFNNPDRAKAIGAGGRDLVQSNFAWESVNAVFEKYCRHACELASRRVSSGVESDIFTDDAVIALPDTK